jgi:phosphatidylserine synthase 2
MRQLLGYFDSSLGHPVTKGMHTYDDNCEFLWENIYDNLDHYFWIHVINWAVAAFIVRDAYVLHFWSVFDEIIELSWQHKLPHFRECWWDHVLLDVLASNTPAIIVGSISYLMHSHFLHSALGLQEARL